jgi:four helix bundle protein
MRRHNFKNLNVWKESIDIIDDIYEISSQFPDFEKFGLQSQMNRSAVSIASNIAEGTSKKSDKFFIKYLENSLGSAFELETQLIISKRRNYITEEVFKSIDEKITLVQKKIVNLIDSLDVKS